MSKTALVFPGQASQYVGMGKDLYDASQDVRALYEFASSEMNIDLADISFNGPAQELTGTRITQPAILVHSLSILTMLGTNIPEFSFAAGHSLGEYGALAVTGVLSYRDAIRAVVKRAALMEQACQTNRGTMAAIIGLDDSAVEDVCQKARSTGVVVLANFNSSTQIVISGDLAAVEKAAELAREAGAKRVMILQVGGAFHSPLMQSAVAPLEDFLKEIKFSSASVPVVANVSGVAENDGSRMKQLLVKQVTEPVRWSQTMAFLAANDVDELIEVGPGKVLTGLARRDLKPQKSTTLDTLGDLEQYCGLAA